MILGGSRIAVGVKQLQVVLRRNFVAILEHRLGMDRKRFPTSTSTPLAYFSPNILNSA